MPVNPCSENGQPGFKWGDSGKCYLYTRGDAKSMGEAKRKATIQGIATGEYDTKKSEEHQQVAEDLAEQEAALADALVMVAERFGPFDAEGTGIYVDYESAEENEEKSIGVHCHNCVLYMGDGNCKILSQKVEHYGKCRFAIIPDNLVMPEMEDEEEDEMEEDDNEKDSVSTLISILRELFNKEK